MGRPKGRIIPAQASREQRSLPGGTQLWL